MKEPIGLIAYNKPTLEMKAILDCVIKLSFRGQESILRLKSLNRLAHEAAMASLQYHSNEEDFSYAERQLARMDCFILNRHSLNGLEILTGQNSETGFGKIKNRLIENLRFYIQEEKSSPIRHKMLLEV